MENATEKLRELCDRINGDFEVYPFVYGPIKTIAGSQCTVKLRGSKILELGLSNRWGETDFNIDVFKGPGYGPIKEGDRIIHLSLKDPKDLELEY